MNASYIVLMKIPVPEPQQRRQKRKRKNITTKRRATYLARRRSEKTQRGTREHSPLSSPPRRQTHTSTTVHPMHKIHPPHRTADVRLNTYNPREREKRGKKREDRMWSLSLVDDHDGRAAVVKSITKKNVTHEEKGEKKMGVQRSSGHARPSHSRKKKCNDGHAAVMKH